MIITITTIVTILSIITIVMINSGYGRLWKSWTGGKPQLFSPIHGEKAASRKSEFPSLSPMSPLPSSPSSSILVIVPQHHLDHPSHEMSIRWNEHEVLSLASHGPAGNTTFYVISQEVSVFGYFCILVFLYFWYFCIWVFLYFGNRICWQDIFRINNHITAKLRQWFFSGDLASSSHLIGSSKLWREYFCTFS